MSNRLTAQNLSRLNRLYRDGSSDSEESTTGSDSTDSFVPPESLVDEESVRDELVEETGRVFAAASLSSPDDTASVVGNSARGLPLVVQQNLLKDILAAGGVDKANLITIIASKPDLYGCIGNTTRKKRLISTRNKVAYWKGAGREQYNTLASNYLSSPPALDPQPCPSRASATPPPCASNTKKKKSSS